MIRNGFVKLCDGVWINLKQIHSFCVSEEEKGPNEWKICVAVKSPPPKEETVLWFLDGSFTTREEAEKVLDRILIQGGIDD